MKVHLIRTPEFSEERLKEVYDILSSYNGPMKFCFDEYNFSTRKFKFLQEISAKNNNFKIKKEELDMMVLRAHYVGLSWDNLFSVCNFYRKKFKISKNDFVVLLTSRKNELNWFSHYDNKNNVFVHTKDWDKFKLKTGFVYPVAFQVIENILQRLMKIDIEDPNCKIYHLESIGCINDFCEDKQKILLKLRTADICDDCIDRINELEINILIQNQIIQILEGLRLQFIFKKEIVRNTGPYTLKIEEKYKFLIPQLGNLEIKLTPLFKAIYILFLENPEGIILNQLSENRNRLIEIYAEMEPYLRLGIDRNERTINALFIPNLKKFNSNMSKMNKKLEEQLGKDLSEFYKITGKRGEPFRIKLSPELTEFQL